MSRDIIELWMVKFGESPVIHQVCQGFLLPKICAIQYFKLQGKVVDSYNIIMLHAIVELLENSTHLHGMYDHGKWYGHALILQVINVTVSVKTLHVSYSVQSLAYFSTFEI